MSEPCPCLICDSAPLPAQCQDFHEERAVWFAVGLASVMLLRGRGREIQLCEAHGRTVSFVLRQMAPEKEIKGAEKAS